MRRIFYKGIIEDTIEITGSDAHHLAHVMRGKVGDEITVADDEGTVALMEMAAFTKEAVTLKLIEKLAADTESFLDITLAQCILKGDKMDFVVQKAVELGVKKIIPLMSQNTVARYEGKKVEQKRQRWQKIADEAAKQCGRTKLIEVAEVTPLEKFLQPAPENLVFCYENEEEILVKDVLSSIDAKKVTALIGAEGGFSLAEAEAIINSGGRSVTLGKRILRAETAAVAAMTIIQYELGDLGGNIR